MRDWKAVSAVVGMCVVFVSAAVSGAGAACKLCDPFLRCVDSTPGAKICVEGPASCTMVLPCFGGGGRVPDSPEEYLTTWTLFDADAAGPSSIGADVGPLAVGEELRRGPGAPRGPLADAALAHGREFALVLSDAMGGGFALRRTVEGAYVRLEVREVSGDQPGRVLADALLAGQDRLSVSVRVAGRDRVLVLQSAAVHAAGLGPELARLRGSLRAAARRLPERGEPLLRVRAL